MDNQNIEEKLLKNWDLYINLVNCVENKEVKTGLINLCEEQHERLITCPASTQTKYVGAYAGGLVSHSLNVLKTMKDMNKTLNTLCLPDDIIVTSLFHDVGKIGNLKEDYYLPQESNWHKDRGIVFEINPKLGYVPVISKSIWWLNHYKVPMSENVLEALFSMYSSTVNNRTSEIYNVSNLSLLLQNATRVACVLSKGKTSILD